MKIGFYSESPADQAALAIFTESILGSPPEPISMDLEARGVSDVLKAIDGVYRGVHYNSDAEGLVVVVDCDDSELHALAHDEPGTDAGNCRFCQVSRIIARARSRLKPRPTGIELKVAIGLTVPAIEAWYLVGKDIRAGHQVGEAQWKVALADGKRPFTRPQLKEIVYGTDRPSIELETERAIEEARRIVNEKKDIESAFPIGFGLMAQEIRKWKV